MLAAVVGLWMVVRQKVEKASVLLWVPLAFYVYSIAYGSVPIFIPQLYPHSYYNSRYGMEMLPALALFACIAAAALERRMATPAIAEGEIAGATAKLYGREKWVYLVGIGLAVANPLAMIYGASLVQRVASRIEHHPSHLLANYTEPLVLKEALVNSSTRVPFERNLALVLEELPPGVPILMAESDHIGALQDAGIPLRQTINESDWDSWHAALEDPAGHAKDLQELTILCSTGQPCARVYQSDRYSTPGVPATK
jgi:hypothetical protein